MHTALRSLEPRRIQSYPLAIRRNFWFVEPLESRIAPATHVWTGLGTDNLWSNSQNWTNGAPDSDLSGDVDLVFSTNLINTAQLTTFNDIPSLVVDSIIFNATAGTVGLTTFATGGQSKNGYTIDGLPLFIKANGPGQDPFGIDVVNGSADPTSGITHTINAGLTVFTSNATFRVQDQLGKLILGSVNIGGNTLTIDTNGLVHMKGNASNGDLVKSNFGTLQLSGSNSFTDATFNGGLVIADSNNNALGSSGGTLNINDPARVELRDGITVTKALMNLNSNALGGGIGANGNTTNTFRGSVVLMGGAGGVAMGAGVGVENIGTRLIIDGVISGATSTLSLNGAGVIEFTKNNTYTGLTNHNGNNGFGAIQIDAPAGLGAGGPGNETQLNRNGAGPTGSALWLNFNGILEDGAAVGERINFAGSGVNGLGAIRSLGDSNVTITGNINFIPSAPWVFGVDGEAGSITTTGIIDDQGANRALTKIGAGTLNISGSAANSYSGGTIVKAGTLSITNLSTNPLGDTPTMMVPNALTLENGATLAGSVGLFDPGFSNTVTATGTLVSPGFAPGTSIGLLKTGPLTLTGASTVRADITGPSPFTDYDIILASGAVNLGDSILDVRLNYTPTPGTQFFLIVNDLNTAPVSGTFAGLPEGARFTTGGGVFTISYVGGAGNNDVVLTAVAPESDFTLSNGNKTATFTDVDGDKVKVTTTAGQFSAADFTFVSAGDNRQALQKLVLGAGFKGANISIVATATADGGNGFVNLGFLEATGVDLGSVTVDGDLGQIKAGTVGGDASVPGAKALTVQSLGLFNTAMVLSSIEGALPKLTIKGDMRASLELNGATDGKLGTAVIGGNITSSSTSMFLRTGAGISSLKIGGDIRNTTTATVSITTNGAIGSMQVIGSIVGISQGNAVVITSFGQLTAPSSGRDLALNSLNVGGSVDFMVLRAGDAAVDNADAAIGSITVGGNWTGSIVQAGTGAGGDGRIGTNDDAKFATMGVRDNPGIISQIGSFTVKGQAFGTLSSGNDMYGVVAEKIGKATVGGRTFAFVADSGAILHREAFYAAPTAPGIGNGNPAFDFTIREVGSTSATVNFGGTNLVISGDGKTATYTDVDGDLVTITRSVGTFTAGNFNILANATGGGQLLDLKVTAAPNNAVVNLTVSSKVGPDGGNGFVNIGEIDATGVVLGNVAIGGDLGRFVGGLGVNGKPGTASFTAKSIGALGTSTGATDLISSFEDGVGKISIATDVRGTLRADGDTTTFGTVSIGGSLVNGDLIASRGMNAVTIKGSARGAHILSETGALGTISIGGDLVGDGVSTTISAFGQLNSPSKGPDLAIKSLDVKGNIDRARIAVGIGTNADASIGKIAVGREWIASNARAGVNLGKDNFIATDDDTKTTGSTLRDRNTSFSTISSIIIKGQALGTVAAGDSFGIVAEQIGSAKVGGGSFAFTPGARTIGDFFEAAPTRPGVVGFTFDFAIGEITKP